MKNFLSVYFLLFLVSAASCIDLYEVVAMEWATFKLTHGKKYANDLEEKFRFKIFAENKKKIAHHNYHYQNGKKSYSLSMNEFGDLLPSEFVSHMNGIQGLNLTALKEHRLLHAASFIEPIEDVSMPKSIDWRKKGAVTEVKNQGHCGSCWSFSATGALEGQHFRATGELVELSEQNLIDCSTKYGNNGCEGGLMDYAFQYIKDNGGIDTEESYPYEGIDDRCQFKKRDVGADDKGYVDIRQGSERALKKALATVGPISVAIDASHSSFQFYNEGVYDEPECSAENLDHGVLAVGYGTDEEGQDYWIVKNSWGETWGENGYVKMARNKDNMCGIASAASYPLV